MEWQQMQTSAQHEVWSLIETLEAAPRRLDFWPDRTTIHFSSYYSLLSSDASACGRLPIDILKNLHTELWRMNNFSFGTHTPMHHWRWWSAMQHWCWYTLSHQLNRRVSILTQRRKKSRAPQLTLAVQKKNGCVFVPHVRANELVSFSSLPVVSVCHHGSSISFADRYLSFLIHGHRATGGRTGLACISVRWRWLWFKVGRSIGALGSCHFGCVRWTACLRMWYL